MDHVDDNIKVFSSNVTRGQESLKNNLRDLLSIEPAKPIIAVVDGSKQHFEFHPQEGKFYVPKKKTRFKVKTVRDIRTELENELSNILPEELEKQKTTLLKKITGGHFKENNTIKIANNLLKSQESLTRSVWQMLMNINPDNHAHHTQYVSYNGKNIQIVGSRGGNNKFLCKFDLGTKNLSYKKKIKVTKSQKKIGLLKNSLDIKIKPGPLTKKKELDNSFQKVHVGSIEIVHLPAPCLEICPKYGIPVESTVTNFLHSLRDQHGLISKNWAQFAVSMVGKVNNKNLVQETENSKLTFKLNYSYNQTRLLMRRSDEKIPPKINNQDDLKSYIQNIDSQLDPEVIDIVSDILNTVEISLNQDFMFATEEPVRNSSFNTISRSAEAAKEKQKKKYGELERLDVTVIRLGEDKSINPEISCNQEHCILGCICASISCELNLKNHCGHVDCMFKCKCDFTKYKAVDCSESDCADLIPSFLHYDRKATIKLAKEEQKFHQTVIVTGEKSIVLKSHKRDWKASKKYGDFYDTMCLKNKMKVEKILSVDLLRINCDNVIAWCMVHNLYNCFCKGKFTHSSDINPKTKSDILCITDQLNETSLPQPNYKCNENNEYMKDFVNSEFRYLDALKTCARLRTYCGRKHNNEYYLKTNKKILLLEKDDDMLRKRLQFLINPKSDKQNNNADMVRNYSLDISHNTNENSVTNLEVGGIPNLNIMEEDNSPSEVKELIESKDLRTLLMNVVLSSQNPHSKTKLTKWLEINYQKYKEKLEKGKGEIFLVPPKQGRVMLYPWEFILGRYRERKNLFLISKQTPFHIYMAVDATNSFFSDCINIDDIRFADLQKYPVTVKNLLTNATDMTVNFVILCGLSHCWEFIGTVAKVNESSDRCKFQCNAMQIENPLSENMQTIEDLAEPSLEKSETVKSDVLPSKNKNDCSKWFFMTIEEDFDEIHFQEKGFFVKHQNIIKAINVARIAGKTVRMSSQKCNIKDPPFGIYATPNKNEYCVFVGPYEEEETLGLNTVRSVLCRSNIKRTRGIWIKTNKIDDLKVIDNPISFIPKENMPQSDIVFVETDKTIKEIELKRKSINSNEKAPEIECSPEKLSKQEKLKVVKPIRIRKSNGFYHLTSKKFKINDQVPVMKLPTIENTFSIPNNLFSPQETTASNGRLLILDQNNKMTKIRPIAEIAPQVKSNSEINFKTPMKNTGMSILKPEEINRRLEINETNQLKNEDSHHSAEDQLLKEDIEKFLSTSAESVNPIVDTLVISDDEDENEPNITEVFIVCKNIQNLDWIPAKKKQNGDLSFELPGFKTTTFYPETKALNMINRVYARQCFVPKEVSLVWEVKSKESLSLKEKMTADQCGPEFILTTDGIIRKDEKVTKTYVKSENPSSEETSIEETSLVDTSVSAMNSNKIAYQTLEDEGNQLWNDTLQNKGMVLAALTKMPDDLRETMTEKLQSLITYEESD